MTGIGGLVAIVVVLGLKFTNFQVLYPLLLSLLLSGVVGSSRLYLDAHKPVEIYTGFIFGFFSLFRRVSVGMGIKKTGINPV